MAETEMDLTEARDWLRRYLHDEGVDFNHNVKAMEREIVAGLAPIIAAQAVAYLRGRLKVLLDEWWSTPLPPSDARTVAACADDLDAILGGAVRGEHHATAEESPAR